ncbi:MAG: hypothetical protein ACOC56_03565 [Atribacterota bacterium]
MEELLEKLYKEFEIDKILSFNEFDVQEKLESNAYRIMQFHDLMLKEEKDIEEIVEKRDSYVGDLYDKLRFHHDESLTKVEIEKYYIPRDEKLKKINKIIRIRETRRRFFEAVCKALDKQGWNMRTFSDNLKRT